MDSRKCFLYGVCVVLLVMTGCIWIQQRPLVGRDSVAPGTIVHRGDKEYRLLGAGVSIGKSLPSTSLVDAMTMSEVDLSLEKGNILFLSVVPSIDTRVCETQTHYLGEEGDKLPQSVQRITISRDTPFAQKRFAQKARLTDIRYLSDYKEGAFGRATTDQSADYLMHFVITLSTHRLEDWWVGLC